MKRIIFAVPIIITIAFIIGAVWIKRQSVPAPSIRVTPHPMSSAIDYSLFPSKASCDLQGTIRYITPATYNNGDARFTYRGVDHPGRNIFWKVTPSDGVDVGPDIFTQLELPDGSSLLSITLPEKSTSKRYTVTASMQYGRLIDGNVKVFTTPCSGATTILLP